MFQFLKDSVFVVAKGSVSKNSKANFFVVLCLGFVVSLNLISCDSPRNHRIKPYGVQEEKTLQSYTFSNFEYTVKPVWSMGPYPGLAEASQLVVFVYDEEGRLVDLPKDLNLGFFAIMPSMGHGLEDAGYFEKVSVGIYENKNITFQMSGDWQLELSILNQNFDELDKVLWIEFF